MPPRSATFPALGVTAQVTVADEASLAAAVAIVQAELRAIDEAYSRFRDDSELTRLNRSAGRTFKAGPLLIEALTAALAAAAATGGDVDPTIGRSMLGLGWDRDFSVVVSRAGSPRVETVPAAGWRAVRVDRARGVVRVLRGVEIDLGATAKALAADRCARLAGSATGAGVLVSLGGDIALAGPPPDRGWPVRVTDDHRSRPTAEADGGDLRGRSQLRAPRSARWRAAGSEVHHIVDPRTGLAAAEVWRTVSVAAASCIDANTASTAAIVRGETALGWLEEQRLPARLVRPDGTVACTSSWPGETP